MSVTIAPKWTKTAPKVTLTQTSETTVTATWSGISLANAYTASISDGKETRRPDETPAYDSTKKIWSATFSGLTEATKYTVTVTPRYATDNYNV